MDSTLLAMIEADPLCEAELRRSPPRALLRDLGDEHRELCLRYERFALFPKKRAGIYSDNSWELWCNGQPPPLAQSTYSVDPETLYGFFENCFVLGTSLRDGADMIAINLNPGPNHGRLFFYWGSLSLGYGCPIIADSITEWIRLTYGAGYDGQTFFHDKRFADRGPIIPDDPRYRGVSGYFDP